MPSAVCWVGQRAPRRSVVYGSRETARRVTGRVTNRQQILKEFGWITDAHGLGVDTPGTGDSAT